jgi:hypothetical protein
MNRPPLNAETIVAAMNDHGVEYVVIGAFAAIAQGAPLEATRDVDLTPRRTAQNLERLSEALRQLGAKIRVDDLEDGLSFDHSGASLAAMTMLNLTCPAGDFDLAFTPAASPAGYDDLAPNARSIHVGAQSAKAADLWDIIRSKEAAGREKDWLTLPLLKEYASRIDRAAEDGAEPEFG